MSDKINFPALVISASSIDKLTYRYLVGDKRLLSRGFRNVQIVDILGNCHDTERVVQSGGLSLFYSIKLVGYMVKVSPILKQPVYKISIPDLRNKLITIVRSYPKKFSALRDKVSLIEQLENSMTYSELINSF